MPDILPSSPVAPGPPEAVPANPVAPGPQGPTVLMTWVGDERTAIYRIPLVTAGKIRSLLAKARDHDADYPSQVNALLAEGVEVETIGIVRTDEEWGWYDHGDDEPLAHP